jgi:hypothetical protein
MMSAPLIATAAACGFAVSTSLQHRAASRVPPAAGAARLMRRLASTPMWLGGSALGLVSFGLHATALHLGALALVQPLMLCGVVLAVPVRAGLERRAPHREEFLAVATTVLGLACFLAATHLAQGSGPPDTNRALLACGVVLVMFLVLVGLARADHRSGSRAALLGTASGVVFGAMAGLIKLLAHDVTTSGWAALGTWRPWVLVLAGATAVTTNQRAFNAGRLADSMPILNVVNVAVAMLFGWFVFDESPVQGPVSLVVQVGAALLVTAGLVWIARLDPADATAASHPDVAEPAPPRSSG